VKAGLQDAADDASTPRPRHVPSSAHNAGRFRTIPFGDERSAYVVMPDEGVESPRLVAMIHGACTGPSYVCGAWASAASDVGVMVCPVGNTTCGPEGTGPPTWEGPFSGIDTDVEASVEATRRATGLPSSREGAILVGYSRGGYAAVILAVRHPGRWRSLIINEADVDLTVPMLRRAGVRSVALIAGEYGTQIAGERRTVDALVGEGYPARLWTMPKVGHPYSPDIESIMREAIAFVLEHKASPSLDASTREGGLTEGGARYDARESGSRATTE
jgi:pimeloyl-ACP methyl ester carboxylesterase